MINTATEPLLPFARIAADASDTRVETHECDRCGRAVSHETAIEHGEGVLVCPECETCDS